MGGAGAAPVAAAASGGTAGLEAQLRNYMESVQGDLRSIRSTQLATQTNSGGASVPASCPNIACTSSTIYFIVTLIQTGVIMIFVFIRSVITVTSNLNWCLQEQKRQSQILLDETVLDNGS